MTDLAAGCMFNLAHCCSKTSNTSAAVPGQTVTNVRCGKELRRTLDDPRANTLRPEEIEIGKHVIDGEAGVDVRNAELHVGSGVSRVTGRSDIQVFRKLMVDLGRACRTVKE